MSDIYIVDQVYEKTAPLSKGTYENCVFNYSDWTNADLSNYKFIDCTFNDCNLSLVKVVNATLRDISFNHCKLVGIQFMDANKFGISFSFDNCILNNSSFYKMKVKKTVFTNSQLIEADFTETDLSDGTLVNCNLSGAIFDQTILERVDFQYAYNYIINPSTNLIKKATFSKNGIEGLIKHLDIRIVS